MSEPYLSRPEAASYLTERGLRISAGTLAKLACIGGGPEYARWGNRCVYTPADLDRWIKSRLTVRRFASEIAE